MHIAIVGSGISGLACGQRLQAEGARVTLFDKARGPGGRMSTRRNAGWQADLGAQYFTARDSAFRTAVQAWQQAGVVAPWHASLVWLDGGTTTPVDDDRTRWVGTPRMSALSRHLAAGLDVRAQHAVEHIAPAPTRGWQIHTRADGIHGPFDGIAVAVPANQAAPLLQPVAPALAAQAEATPMQGCWSAALRVSADRPAYDGAFVIDAPLRWFARDGSKPGRGDPDIWVVHGAGHWSDARIDEDPATIGPELVDAWCRATGCEHAPTLLTVHRWRYSQSAAPLTDGCLFDADGRIGACGDWCHGDRVEGAWCSGQRLADQLFGRP